MAFAVSPFATTELISGAKSACYTIIIVYNILLFSLVKYAFLLDFSSQAVT